MNGVRQTVLGSQTRGLSATVCSIVFARHTRGIRGCYVMMYFGSIIGRVRLMSCLEFRFCLLSGYQGCVMLI